MIRLFDYWRSSASYRVRIALGLAGLAWESVSVNLLEGEQLSEEHLRRNPQGLVPALEIDGQLLTQSLAIIEYLDETRELGLIPSDPARRARCMAMAYAVAMEIHPVCNLRVAKFAVEHSGGGISMEGWMQEFIAPGLASLETMTGTHSFLSGETITIADICLVPQLYNARRWGVNLHAFPKLSRIGERLDAVPAVAAAHPDNAPGYGQ